MKKVKTKTFIYRRKCEYQKKLLTLGDASHFEPTQLFGFSADQRLEYCHVSKILPRVRGWMKPTRVDPDPRRIKNFYEIRRTQNISFDELGGGGFTIGDGLRNLQ